MLNGSFQRAQRLLEQMAMRLRAGGGGGGGGGSGIRGSNGRLRGSLLLLLRHWSRYESLLRVLHSIRGCMCMMLPVLSRCGRGGRNGGHLIVAGG